MSDDSYKRKLEDLIRDEEAFDAANDEISRLHDKLFAAIAVAASKKMVEEDVEVGKKMARKGMKRVSEHDDMHAKKRKM